MIAGFDLDSFLAGACAGVILHRLRVVWVPHGLLGRLTGGLGASALRESDRRNPESARSPGNRGWDR